MLTRTVIGGVGLVIFVLAAQSCSTRQDKYISEADAITIALEAIDVEVLGIRMDTPDTQWDVFVRSGEDAYEVEIDAVTGVIVAAEKESLAEIKAELSGDLSHEGTTGDVDP